VTMFTIPVPSGTDAFTEQVDLDGKLYELSLRWNARDRHWMMDISTGGATLLSGLKLVVSPDLLAFSRRIDGLPPGKLIVADLDGHDRDPDDKVFGERVMLQYEEANA
jgi:hypothetical protein